MKMTISLHRVVVPLIVMITLTVVFSACGGSSKSATITRLAFGKNETAEPSVNTFDINDAIFAIATVPNVHAKHSLYFSVTSENVAEWEKGTEVMTKSVDFESVVPLRLEFSVAYPGEYKIEATLSDEAGKKLDSKSGMITVTGEAAPLENEEGDRDKDQDKDKVKTRDKDREKERDKEEERDRDHDKHR